MNFDQVIMAHASWKRKLKTYLEKPDGSLKPEEIGVDNKCELGQWIGGEGRQYSKMTEFTTLTAAHTRFHKAAAELVQKANSGEKVDGEVALGARSAFSELTNEVVSCITAMKGKV